MSPPTNWLNTSFDQKTLDTSLTKLEHESGDIHFIGEALPAPSLILPDSLAPTVGNSPITAREDHSHGTTAFHRPIFANTTERDAWTGIKITGMHCYVENVTIGGVTSPADFIWIGSGWRLWDFPAVAPSFGFTFNIGSPFPRDFSASIAQPTLGTGGFIVCDMAVRGRRLQGNIRGYWGSTAGAPGNGNYYWRLPLYFFKFSDYATVGVFNYYAASGLLTTGITRLSSGFGDERILEAVPHGTTGPMSSTNFPGGTNVSFMLTFNGPLDLNT